MEEVVVENNYLSQKQQARKDKEIAECQTVACKAGAQAKWTAIDLGQDGSFAAGMVAGVPAGLYDAVDSIVKTASSPQETYDALKSLFNSGDVLGNVSDAVKQSYIDRIDRMETEYQKAGASGSFNAGVEGGKLVTDIASLVAGGAGVVKVTASVTEKIVAKVASKAGKALPEKPPLTWKAGEGAYSQKSEKGITNVEHPEGKYDGGSLPYDKEKGAEKAEAASSNVAKNIPSEAGKINAGKIGHIDLEHLSKSGANIDSAAKSGNFTTAGRGLQKHGSREGSAYPAAKGTPAQINEQGQKVLDGIIKAPGASVKEGNRFGGFDVIAPDGRGARFDPQGNFRGFLEP